MLNQENFEAIDFHIHIGLKEHWLDGVHSYQQAAHSDYYDRYEEFIDPIKFAAYLKSNNIAKAVILPEISPITTGVVPNEYVLEFCRGHDIFLPFCTVNPSLVSKPGRELQKYIDQGAKGLKLYPSYNHFYPNDQRIYPLYEIAQKYRIPVLVHTGSSVFQGSKIKFSDPIHLDDVSADFPDLVVVMAHGGRGFWYSKAFFLSRIHPNLYLEISGLPPQRLLGYYPELEKNIDKIIYGSDWPGIATISSNIKAIKKLPLAPTSITKILFENAARILRL
jgi:predicted TIM-barrel fold metal-dependent hydrolase